MIISMDKQYRTRDGRKVRIYAVDGYGDYPIHGAILTNVGWIEHSWRKDGGGYNRNCALIEVKPRIQREVWMNVYADNCYNAFHTRREADEVAYERIACVKVTIDCEEGEGL